MYSLIITKQMEWSWHAYLNIFNLKIKYAYGLQGNL